MNSTDEDQAALSYVGFNVRFTLYPMRDLTEVEVRNLIISLLKNDYRISGYDELSVKRNTGFITE